MASWGGEPGLSCAHHDEQHAPVASGPSEYAGQSAAGYPQGFGDGLQAAGGHCLAYRREVECIHAPMRAHDRVPVASVRQAIIR